MAGRSVAVDFIGHSAAVIELDGMRVLTDPATRSRIGPLRRVVAVPERRTPGGDRRRAACPTCTGITSTFRRSVTSGRDVSIITPAGSGDWLRAAGFDHVREMRSGEVAEIGGIRIEGVPAHHSGFRPPLGPTAETLGFVLRGSRSVYFAGDTDLFPAMSDLADTVDLALIPVWGWGPTLGRGRHLDPSTAAEAVRIIRPRAVMPIHWGTYWPHALGRVYPKRLIEPPLLFTTFTTELSPEVRPMPTAVGDRLEFHG